MMDLVKLLVNTPDGRQDVIEVGAGGGYFDKARVLWDERKDGPLPASVKPGGMVREGAALRLDAGLLAAHEEIKAQEEAQPKPRSLEERITALETAIAELRAGK